MVTVWTARAAALLFVAAVWPGRSPAAARAAWTAGCAAFLAHVAAAFHFHHHWSHAAAYAEVARQTGEWFGDRAASGFGLYLNYLFTAVWTADAVWWWIAPRRYGARSRFVAAAIPGFMAFMIFNGAVVFAPGPMARWIGLGVALALGAARLRARRTGR